MNPLTIGSTINPDTQVMTIHYDGCEIRIEPILIGTDVLVERRIDFRIIIDGIAKEDARYEETYEINFQGKSKLNHIKFNHKTLQKPKSKELDFELKKVLFAINDIPVRHTKKDPMDKIERSLLSIKISLVFNVLILITLLIQKYFLDAVVYSFFVSMTFIAILSFKRYHFFGLIFGAFICIIEMILSVGGIIVNNESTILLYKTILYAISYRAILLYGISTGIISAWKIKQFNKYLHLELSK